MPSNLGRGSPFRGWGPSTVGLGLYLPWVGFTVWSDLFKVSFAQKFGANGASAKASCWSVSLGGTPWGLPLSTRSQAFGPRFLSVPQAGQDQLDGPGLDRSWTAQARYNPRRGCHWTIRPTFRAGHDSMGEQFCFLFVSYLVFFGVPRRVWLSQALS